ncbi:MAG: DUF4386 domain-containing protein [Candidatus Cyclobacteriaceae bacterium M3_2C_046]
MDQNLKNKARITGVFYLLVILLAGFSQGYVRGTLFIPGQAQITTENLASSIGLFRLGLVTDLIAFILDAVISILLYQLLKSVNITLVLIMASFRLLAHPALASLNLLNHYMAGQVAQGGFIATNGIAEKEIWTMFFMQAHNAGYLLAGAFFGVHCMLLGVLLFRAYAFPKVLGVLMVLAASGYLMETFGNFLMPGYEAVLAVIVGFSAAIGEVSFTLYLIVKGVKISQSSVSRTFG